MKTRTSFLQRRQVAEAVTRLPFLAGLLLMLLVPGCALFGIPEPDPDDPANTNDGVMVLGKVNYVIDGRLAAPYGTKNAVPAPSLDLLNLDTGKQLHTKRVQAADGTFIWRLPPGHYVITAIGPGKTGDPYRGAWPQVAFEVPSVIGPIYLGHLQLLGTHHVETVKRPNGETETYTAIRYTYAVLDEHDEAAEWMRRTRGSPLVTSLMFHNPDMPAGDELIGAAPASRPALVQRIFGAKT